MARATRPNGTLKYPAQRGISSTIKAPSASQTGLELGPGPLTQRTKRDIYEIPDASPRASANTPSFNRLEADGFKVLKRSNPLQITNQPAKRQKQSDHDANAKIDRHPIDASTSRGNLQHEQPVPPPAQASANQDPAPSSPDSNVRVTRSKKKQDGNTRAPVTNMGAGQSRSSAKVKEPIDPAPDPEEQPELAEEFEHLSLPAVEVYQFFGHGDWWNELTQRRRTLLCDRPDWFKVASTKDTHFPMSSVGREALKKLSVEPDLLIQNLTKLDQVFGNFKEAKAKQVKLTNADLCHLIIPRLIRCVYLACGKAFCFGRTANTIRTQDLALVSAILKLFEHLHRLSRVARNMELDDMPLSQSEEVSEALETIGAKSDDLKNVLKEIKTEINRRWKEQQEKEREREEIEERKENDRQKFEEKAENQRTLKASRMQLELRQRNAEQIALAKEVAKRRWMAEERIRAFRARQVWDRNFEKLIEERNKSAIAYYKDMHPKLFESKHSALPAIEAAESRTSLPKNVRPAVRSAVENVQWTVDLSCILITRLAKFSHLSAEPRYAKCLDCKELQSMSVTMIRERAMKIKPSLEENYRKLNQSIPAWVARIA